MFWFFRKIASKAVQKAAPPKPPMDDATLATVLKVVNDELRWSIDYRLNKPWSLIPPVRVTTKFAGWGYVEGRTKALIINARLALCEADDDMDFVEYCVLMDGVPTLLILRRGYRTTVTIVAERDFLADVFRTAAMPMNTLEEFRQMPEPVQKVMNDVLDKLYSLYMKVQAEKEAKNPIEKMINY